MISHHRPACYQNPLLGPDAWAMVEKRRPVKDGAKASLICRFSCQLRNACPFGEDKGAEIIANGGGWFTTEGKFIKPPEDMLETNQAAAYVGVTHEQFLAILRGWGTPRTRGPGYVTFVPLKEVQRIAETHGPGHGTVLCYNQHLLRGEVPCYRCTAAKEVVEATGARVLRRGVR